jgi:elongation factor Ts
MAVTALMIKELRNKTGAGVAICKEALTKSDGNMEMAEMFLREKGLIIASKKADRSANEGRIYTDINAEKTVGVIIEVNSETDFVARNEKFIEFVKVVTHRIAESNIQNLDEFYDEESNKNLLNSQIALFGENIKIRRFVKYQTKNSVYSYMHTDGRIAVLVEVKFSTPQLNDEFGKNIAMQVAALGAKYISRDDIPIEFLNKEKEKLMSTISSDVDKTKIINDMINNNLAKICLLEQEYIKDSSISVAEYIKQIEKSTNSNIELIRFVRYQVGEDLENTNE